MSKQLFIVLTIRTCSALTFQDHISHTRYPKNGKTPDMVYKRRIPLIKNQPEFMLMLKLAIKKQ